MWKAARIVVAAVVVGLAAAAPPAAAQTASIVPSPPKSSSERVRDNPSSQYVLIKTVVGQSIGIIHARALPVEPEGYNLLKYCWAVANVLGDWSEHAGLTGAMVTRALETHSWARDLVRAGYPAATVGEVIGHYEAALIAAGFTDAARERALDAMTGSLEEIRRAATGAARIFKANRCGLEIRSTALNHKTAPEGGRVRFIPYVLHQICRAQQLDADDPVRCDYWMNARADGPMLFPGEMVYSVRWPDGAVAGGQFDPDASRDVGSVTLRARSLKK
ncbi:MAG: hypothetical protein EPO55_05220 [Reyranella sp.]|uniref:hypothetical protein n=1 Tax=Reyranella sp. TaxID=1929291 RepID=UPI0012160AC8|nr:hypothetical protein [Reyranella sp.]TAJ41474.1 MAG: hypothetical protein EPO55_05220 [Reyranella sp.]